MSAPLDIQNLSFVIADEDKHMRGTISGILRHFNCRNVKEAETGPDLLALLDSFQPDIIMTEWDLPEKPGIQIVKEIRDSAESPHRMKPFIMISAHSKKFEVEKARDCGVNEFLVKPINSNSVYARIVSVITAPRAFILTDHFNGPDRRRRHDAFLVGKARREMDQAGGDGDAMGDITEDEINAMLGL